VQGVVVEAETDNDMMLVDDGTGVIHVRKREGNNFTKSEGISKGSHIMVVGPLVENEAGHRYISSFHIVPLVANNDIEESFWFAEVVEFWQHH
jgi:hypothetical protein